MRYIKFDHNKITCNIFSLIQKFYHANQQSENIINYLKEISQFDVEAFKKFISVYERRNSLHIPIKSEFDYTLKIQTVNSNSFVVLEEIVKYQNTIYIIEHVFY